MSEKIQRTMHEFIRSRFESSKINTILQNRSLSHLIEITGKSGSGKSYMIEPITESFKEAYPEILIYSPNPYYFNHLREIIKLLTKIDDNELELLLRHHRQQYATGRKYDFFYYLSETLNSSNLLHPCLMIIDDCDVMDAYTRDFLQYLVHYAEDIGIQIVAFSQQRLFPFSDVEFLQALTIDELQKILQKVFSNNQISYVSESEILHRISEGNLMIVERILIEMKSQQQDSGFDLSGFLDRRFDVYEIYSDNIAALNDKQKSLLTVLYVLNRVPVDEFTSMVCTTKACKKELDALVSGNLIAQIDNYYTIHKKTAFGKWLALNTQYLSKESLHIALEYIQNNAQYSQIMVKLMMLYKEYNAELTQQVVESLINVSDNENLLILYEYMLQWQSKPIQKLEINKKIGETYSDLSQKEKAIDYFRQCLHICTEQKLPAEEIIYLLTSTLFAANSSSFALEIIRKYSPSTIDTYWKTKILLLKAEILNETEQYDDSFNTLDEVMQSMTQLDDKVKRYIIQAEAKKTKGKIHYYTNEWEQAEQAFKDAETMYSLAGDQNGLAAIYNNLGVLYMFQGEWEKSEQFFQHSLNLEMERYNLNGISICFNNLGGLMDDKGDRNRSLYYLEEALKIQRLLSEPYNITNIYNNIGVTCMDNNDFDRAEEALLKSLETALNFSFFRNTVASLNNLGALFFKKGHWDKAIDYHEQAIKKSQDNNFTEGLLRSFNNLGEIYEKQGELNLAYDLYFKGLEMLPAVSDEYIKAELYGNLGSVLTKLHKFKEAYSYLVESFDFFKSLNAKAKIIEGCQKQAYYFILTRNYESADYYLTQASKVALELNLQFEIGRTHYLRALLERKNLERAKELLNEAIKLFVETSNNYELSLANYELASVLYELNEWEQALQILKTNKKIVRQFGSIKLLEQNDLLIQKITRDYSAQMKDVKFEENLLNQFYEITQALNAITDLDVLLEHSINSLVEISEADGGILCLYNNPAILESWDYKIYNNFSHDDKHYETFMELCVQTWSQNSIQNFKQPHFAPDYNNIVVIPLCIRNNALGVVLLFSRHGSHYFSERIVNLLSALNNQIIVIVENIRSVSLEKSHAIIREQLNTSSLYSNIIGTSPEIRSIFDLIEKIKDTPTSVLVEGPSGTGKELIARALHYSSNRRNKAFVAQYCGALPETLLESELFGHVKGSFTGAAYDKKGLFEIADGGTFFLDEIADISLSTQAKLLRFLQEGEIKRVGATRTEKVDVRVVCATNVPLLDKVKKGDFRLDLYYRLNVIRIEVPPLKKRSGDIPLLAIHFLDKYNKRINKSIGGITDEAMKCLERYDWPGNVRQLENEIERAVTLVDNGKFIVPTDLSEEVYRFFDNQQTIKLLNHKKTLKDVIDELERKMILEALNDSNWNQTQAAKDLGLSRQGLMKKIKRHHLDKEE